MFSAVWKRNLVARLSLYKVINVPWTPLDRECDSLKGVDSFYVQKKVIFWLCTEEI